MENDKYIKVEFNGKRYIANSEVYSERINICSSCEHKTRLNTCDLCGCFLPGKAKLLLFDCPDNRWPKMEKPSGN
mgnify:CR=1 FL=1